MEQHLRHNMLHFVYMTRIRTHNLDNNLFIDETCEYHIWHHIPLASNTNLNQTVISSWMTRCSWIGSLQSPLTFYILPVMFSSYLYIFQEFHGWVSNKSFASYFYRVTITLISPFHASINEVLISLSFPFICLLSMVFPGHYTTMYGLKLVTATSAGKCKAVSKFIGISGL